MYCVTITDAHLDTLQWVSLIYYLRESNRENGLVADKTMPGSPSSIAAIGLSLATAPVVVEREILSREEAAVIVLKKLRGARCAHEHQLGPKALVGVANCLLQQRRGIAREIARLEGGVGDGWPTIAACRSICSPTTSRHWCPAMTSTSSSS